MGQTHRRVGRVNALAARPARAVHVDSDVVRIEIDFNVVRQHRQQLDAGERRVPARFRIGRGNAHEPMHADFRLQHAVGVTPFELNRRTVDADAFGVRDVEHMDFPALRLAVARVHLEQHVSPVIGFKTTLTGVDR